MKSRIRFIALGFLILALAVFLRFYRIADTPHDLYIDEVSIGYNAYSILTTGKDEYGTPFPSTFRSFNEYKLPAYIYITSVSEFVFGKSTFAVRFPSALASSATVLFFMLLVFRTAKDKRLTIIAGMLLAISPWHLQFGRAGFETSLALFFLVSGVYFLLKSTSALSFFTALLCLLLSMYTYNALRVLAPLLFIGVYLLRFGKKFPNGLFRSKGILFSIFLVLIFAVPFFRFTFSAEGLTRIRSESFLRDVRYDPRQFFTNTPVAVVEQLAKNYLSYFSLDFLFFSGDGNGRHGIREMGPLYMWQLPFLLIGIFASLRPKTNDKRRTTFFLYWLLAGPIPAVVVSPNPHALRTLPLVIPLTYFTAEGIYIILKYFKLKIQNSTFITRPNFNLWIMTSGFLLIALPYSMLSYLHIYYVHYPKRTDPDWSGGYKELVEETARRENQYDTIAITDEMGLGYIYFFFYGPFQPRDTQKRTDWSQGFGKYRFIRSPYIAKANETVLYAAPHWEKQWPGTLIKIIHNRGNDIVFHLWESSASAR